MIVKMVKDLRRRMDEQSEKSEVFSKELENIKKNQTEVKNIIIEMKNTLQGINSRWNDTEEWNSELEDKSSGNHWSWTKKRKKNEKKEGQFTRPLGQHKT